MLLTDDNEVQGLSVNQNTREVDSLASVLLFEI